MSLDRFAMFSPMHALVVVVLAAATAGLVTAVRGKPAADRKQWRVGLGVIAVVVLIANQVFWLGFRPGSGESLPLHLCDLAGFVAAGAFLVPTRPLRALLYYWGAGLSSLGFIVPVLQEGPSSPAFWLFWLSHWVIVGGAIYLVTVDGFRPGWRDLGFACICMIALGLLTFFLNRVWGTNYMYTGDHPMPTPGSFTLAWPWPRVPAFGAAAVGLMFLAHLPWLRAKAVRG